MEDLPTLPTVEPLDLVRLLEERFGSVGVKSPDGRLFVNLAWLYHHAANYMETMRKATQEMVDEDSLGDVLAATETYVESLIHYAQEVKPEIHDIFEEH
jgi:hypothetical protein